jgi:hypothetical protein
VLVLSLRVLWVLLVVWRVQLLVLLVHSLVGLLVWVVVLPWQLVVL